MGYQLDLGSKVKVVAYSNTTVTPVGLAGATTLATLTLPGMSLTSDGDEAIFEFGCNIANNANAKTINASVAGNVVLATAYALVLPVTGKIRVIRTGGGTANVMADMVSLITGAALTHTQFTQIASAGLFSTSFDFILAGTAVATGDIVHQFSRIVKRVQ